MNEKVTMEEHKLKRVLTLSDVLAYGLLYFVPMAPIAVFGFIYNNSGGMPALAYLFAGVAMIFSAISYSEMAKKIPLSGSVYSYVSKGVNPSFGFVAGWAILLDYLLLPAVLAIFGGYALQPLFPAIPRAFWIALFVALPMLVNLYGIELNAKLSKILLTVQLVVLGIFFAFAVYRIAAVGITAEQLISPLYNKETFSIPLVFAAVPLAALAFIGFDAVSTLNEEAIGGGATVSKATLILLVVVTLLFVVQVYFAAVFVPKGTVFGPDEAETAFYTFSVLAVGNWFMPVITVTNGILAILANAMVSQATTSKVIFNMARDGRLPVQLAKLSARRTPHRAIVSVAILSLVIALLGIRSAEFMTTLVTFGAMSAYALLNVAVMIYFRGKNDYNVFKHLISPVAGVIILGYALYSADPNAKILGVCWIILGIAVTFILKKLNKLDEIKLDF